MMMEKHFQYWAALALFSLVNLSSLTNLFEMDQKYWSTTQRWVISAASISLIMSVATCFMQIAMKERFTGKSRMEIGWVVVVLAMWCASLPYLMDDERGFAVAERSRFVQNANIFFSAWGALATSLMLATSHFEIYYNRFDDHYLYEWVGFSATSLVVWCDTARFFTRNCGNDAEFEAVDEMCNRAAFGIALGAFSSVAGISIAWLQVKLMFAQMISLIFLLAWAFGVAYLTFDEGPATAVGSLYFATWLSLIFILFVAAHAVLSMFHELLGFTPEEETPAPAEEGGTVTKDEVVDTKVGGDDAEEEEVAETA